MDTVAPQVDLQHQQDLAGALQSSRFLSVLIALAGLLFALGGPPKHSVNLVLSDVFSDTIHCMLVQAYFASICPRPREMLFCYWALLALAKPPYSCSLGMARHTTEQ